MEDISLINRNSEGSIEYINECVREVCINGADLNNYEKMIGKLFPNEENFYMKVSAFITECGKLSSKSSISATSVANLTYLAREIHVTDDTVKDITRFAEQELQKRKKEAERKAEEERKRREAQRKAEEERKRKAEEERKRKEEEEKVETVRYYVNEYVRLACIEREFSDTLRDNIRWLIWPNEHDFFNKVDNFISKCHNLRNTFIMDTDVINLNYLARDILVTEDTVNDIVKFIKQKQEQERTKEAERKRKAEEESKRKEAERKAEEERKRKEEYDRKVEELSKQMEERKRKEAELKAEVEHKDEEEVNNIIGFIGVLFWLAITIGIGIFGCCVSGLGGLILGSLLGSYLGLIVVGFFVNFCTSVRKKIKTKE